MKTYLRRRKMNIIMEVGTKKYNCKDEFEAADILINIGKKYNMTGPELCFEVRIKKATVLQAYKIFNSVNLRLGIISNKSI